MIVDETFFIDTILRNAQQIGTLRCRSKGTHLIDGIGIHVLEFVGEYVGSLCQFADGVDVVVFGGDLEISHLRGRTIGVGSSTPILKPIYRADSAIIRPSCPPPMMPMVAPGIRRSTRPSVSSDKLGIGFSHLFLQ